MLKGQWLNKVVQFIKDHPAILTPSDFNSKSESTYNAQRAIKGLGSVNIIGCGDRKDGRMDHIGADDWPMTEDEIAKQKAQLESMHFTQD